MRKNSQAEIVGHLEQINLFQKREREVEEWYSKGREVNLAA